MTYTRLFILTCNRSSFPMKIEEYKSYLPRPLAILSENYGIFSETSSVLYSVRSLTVANTRLAVLMSIMHMSI